MSKRLVAVDYDGTWAQAPKFFADLGKTLRDAGWTVVVLTGNPNAEALLKDDKKSFDHVVVAVSDPHDENVTAVSKEKWLEDNDADLLIDNNVTNCIAATSTTDAALFFAKRDKDVKAKKAFKREGGFGITVATANLVDSPQHPS